MKKIKELSKLLLKRNLSIITVESCTGGLFASQLNSLPGSSNFFEFGIVCYSNTSKEKILKIPKKQILKHGAVSEQISNMMNDNIKSIFDVNAKKHVIVSITGIAGPSGGSVIKPIGTTYITINYKKKNQLS